MSAGPTVSIQKIIAATPRDPSMREVLLQIAAVSQQQQAVTGTTPQRNASPGNPNPNAPLPAQSKGTVSVLNQNSQIIYVVNLVPPGGKSAVSQLQAQQAAGSANSLTPLQPVTPIYYQIRASTSPAFNVNSNTQSFGGDTGSTQTYWTLPSLGKGTWYIQFRSSFDGKNWNEWKNANGGTGLGGLVNQVTVETPGNSTWAVFTMPGGLIMGIGAAELADQGIFDLAQEVYSSGLIAIAGPNGFSGQGNGVSGFTMSDVDIVVPETPAAGIPDYPVEVRMQMAIADTSSTFPANANVFGIAFDPTNENVKLYAEPGGGATWAMFRLPGGARIAIGQGKNLDGQPIWKPLLPWLSVTRMKAVGALTDAVLDLGPVTGIFEATVDATGTVRAAYMGDAGNRLGGQTMNWMAIAWENGAPVQTLSGYTFLTIPLQGGHSVVIGCGVTPTGTAIVLPAGYTAEQMVSIALPASSDNNGQHMRGVQECALIGLIATLVYASTYGGNVQWMLAAWK